MSLDVYTHVMPPDEVPAERALSLLTDEGGEAPTSGTRASDVPGTLPRTERVGLERDREEAPDVRTPKT